MTSEPSAEPTLSTLGPSGSLTAGAEAHIAIGQMAIGRLGVVPDLGSLRLSLTQALFQGGMPEAFIRVTSLEIMAVVLEWFQDSVESFTSATLAPKTEPKKPESTSTSESQNEEMD